MADNSFQDQLFSAVGGGFTVGSFKATEQTSEPSKFASMYKNKGSQIDRATVQLANQKQKRFNSRNHCRRLTGFDDGEEEEEEVDEPIGETNQAEVQMEPDSNTAESMEFSTERRRRRRDAQHQGNWKYKNQLMVSEWLLDKPPDFQEKWLMVPAPVGKRNLIIASNGHTSAYAKNGTCVGRFHSQLPGGSKLQQKWNSEASIMDCIYSEVTKTYYIMDMMLWRQTPMYETETEFRFFWMNQKLQEVPEVKDISHLNHFRFELLPNCPCVEQNIQQVLDCEMNVPLDGLLFYHKETHYTLGHSPLVLWLKPHMIPEALQVPVPQRYLDQAPADYKGFEPFKQQCLEKLVAREAAEKERNQKRLERAQAREQKNSSREVSTVSQTESSAVLEASNSMET